MADSQDDNDNGKAAPALQALRIDPSRKTMQAGGRKRRRWLWPAAGGVALLLIAGALLAPKPQEVQTTSVVTAYGAQQYVVQTASGYVVAQRRAAVSSKATGRLVELTVREGSVVKTGDLLARLDAADVSAQLAVAQTGVAQAEAAVAQARVEDDNARSELKRQEGLVAQGFVSASALDNAHARAERARAALAQAQAALAQARANVRAQAVNRDYTEIRAPFDGVVLVKNANIGDIITPFSSAAGSQGAVVTMADMSTLEVEADVSESSLAKVRLDQPCEITLDALPDARFRGSVSRIVPTVDRAKATVTTKVRFEKLDPRILPEMSAKVSFLSQAVSAEDQKPLLAVNPNAVATRGDAKVVFRLKDNTVEQVKVSTGRKLGELLEIQSELLKSGDKLVANPGDKLGPGSKVKPAGKG